MSMSMFERLISNGVASSSLTTQRRMRKSISMLVRPLYEKLLDDPIKLKLSTSYGIKYQYTPGFKDTLYFWNHKFEEKPSNVGLSVCNQHECNMVKAIIKVLRYEGIENSQITILSPYKGQVRELRKQEKEINVQTVDQYQGDENDVIILSMVRTCKETPFIKKVNRMCVALSRARRAFYIVGNSSLLEKTDHWRQTIDMFRKNKRIGDQLPRQCPRHPDSELEPLNDEMKPITWCTKDCGSKMDCKLHKCLLKCHTDPKKHSNCQQKCDQMLDCGHKCAKKCKSIEKCECQTIVEKKLPCTHTAAMLCTIDPKKFQCQLEVPKVLECKHTQIMRCYESPKTCKEISYGERDCGHVVTAECHNLDNKKRGLCNEEVSELCGNCKNQIKFVCSNRNIHKCLHQVRVKLSQCKHSVLVECHSQNNPISQCKEIVDDELPCRHTNKVPCWTKGNYPCTLR
eukprot:NODE_1640_length_1867_cov_47.249427_g1388_i0.p1 GENE.NODE_1640_length_1867_cov_47.249427_g1388_i0~~NODE_1640_length_1867_cov_47.249427_g1388_i0.p1  ORF type:complete len:457 (+),score=47.08 NODE_1640_length_1867_cov_47.249427_g1388_i0:493-1863(+)